MNRLIMLRHGQSQWNLENRFTGWRDVDLSPTGEAEARAAGERMAKAFDRAVRIDAVLSSTQIRARRTAEIALATMESLGAPVAHLKDGQAWRIEQRLELRERDYGELSGLNKAETAAKYGDKQVHLWRRSYDVRPPGGESLADVVARVTPYYKAAIEPAIKAGRTLLVAAHGNSLRAMLVVLGRYGTQEIPTVEIPTGRPLVAVFESGALTGMDYLA